MSWQNPWALLGLFALVLPVFIHLLSRKRAVLQKFPSLRFLNATRLLPTRSPHLTDIPLLLVRLAILSLAILALTQPLWVSASRTQVLNSSVARVFVVDTSASMRQPAASGQTPADSARTLAQQMAAESKASLVVQTASPAEALPGASAWLNAQGLRGEVVMFSDFSFGTLDRASVERLSPVFGLQLVRVPSVAATDAGYATTLGRVVAVGDSTATRAEWSVDGASTQDSGVLLLAPATTRDLIEAGARAAREVAPRVLADPSHRIAVVFDGAPNRATLMSNAQAPNQKWMANAMLTVRRSKGLSDAAAQTIVGDTTVTTPFAVLARTQQGSPIVFGAQATVNGARTLVFFHRGPASALSVPALLVAIGEAISDNTVRSGRETIRVTNAQLQTFERTPGDVSASVNAGVPLAANRAGLSDARWFWLIALLLLGLETWMRKQADIQASADAT